MKREFLIGLMEGIPKEVVDAIMEENGRDIQAARLAAQEWEQKYTQAVESHGKELAAVQFDALLRQSISDAGGRNHKAIAALLDTEALKAAEQPDAAVTEALKGLKKECGYLFKAEQPPLYATGTGTVSHSAAEPETLAGALREKFERH